MTKKKILQDHKRKGKTFIPPLMHRIGPFKETIWAKTMIPEFLWIALIQDCYGWRDGVELITSLSQIAHKCSPSVKKRVFATINSLGVLTADEQSCIQSNLADSGELLKIQKALMPLIAFYPECPLRFLFSDKPDLSVKGVQYLEQLKSLVKKMYDKVSIDSVMVQATAIWLAFDSGALKVFKGLTLASFPEIEKYPHTELSEKVAGSIRATMHIFFHEPYYVEPANWPSYFWNQGLKIDPCYFEEMADE